MVATVTSRESSITVERIVKTVVRIAKIALLGIVIVKYKLYWYYSSHHDNSTSTSKENESSEK